ncbi:MAG: DUF4433 domain-containing protein [Anaerolineae bacterium]|nr:DUF4433 domain-containing protein [Anaerolineae bacterium]
MNIPAPTPIYRIVHVENLTTILIRGGMHAANYAPDDALSYRTIHNVDIQKERHVRCIPCGPGGVIHDYVPFYFGYRSPMLLQLKTNHVSGYTEGQQPLIYLVSTVQRVATSGCGFVFSDGHGIAAFTEWHDDLKQLTAVDWDMVYQRYWADTPDDMDRQRRKQAEFLVYQFCPWTLITEIGVVDSVAKARVETLFAGFDAHLRRPVHIQAAWYY